MKGGVDATALNRAEAAGLLSWWLDAGVDVGIGEEARNWLRPAIAPQLPLAAKTAGELVPPPADENRPAPQPPPASGRASIDTLHAFHDWLAETADLPLFRAGAGRALPHGTAEAEIMLLSGIPAPEDVAEGRPIAGSAFELTLRMLAAVGFTEAQAYVAALTCFSGAGSRFSAQEADACRESLLHQVALAAPRRLLLLGDMPARILLGVPLATARGKVHRVAGVPTVATFHPRHLLGRSADKSLAWRDLLLLMGEPL